MVRRRKKNIIVCLRRSDGSLEYDKDSLKIMVIDFFKDLYQSSGQDGPWDSYGYFPQLDQVSVLEIQDLVIQEEINETIFNMGPMKASGPDNLYPIFFHC